MTSLDTCKPGDTVTLPAAPICGAPSPDPLGLQCTRDFRHAGRQHVAASGSGPEGALVLAVWSR